MNILITGATGTIGRELLSRLSCNTSHKIICQSRSFIGKSGSCVWIKHDLENDLWSAVLNKMHIDVVFYLSAQTCVRQAKKDPVRDVQSNLLGLISLMEYLRSQKSDRVPHIIFASSATVVGFSEGKLINEETPECPVTFYDAAKLSSETYIRQYVEAGFIKACSLRLANVYGSYASRIQSRGVLNAIYEAGRAGAQFGLLDGGWMRRDYVHISDVVSAFLAAMEHRDATNGKKFYIASGQSVTLREAFGNVYRLGSDMDFLNFEPEIIVPNDDTSILDLRDVVFDCSKFQLATGWIPEYSFDSGIREAFGKKE